MIYKQNQMQNMLQMQENNLNLCSYNSLNPSPFFMENSNQNDFKPKYRPMINNNEMNLINYENDNDNDNNNNINNNEENNDEESDNKEKKNVKKEKKEEKEKGEDPDLQLFDKQNQEKEKNNEYEDDELSSISEKSKESNNEKYFTDHLLAQYEKVRRVKDKWKLSLKGCIVQKDQIEYVCGKLHGELIRDW